MPDLFIYLIKVNVALLVFCAGYYAVLRHLTFYNLNRAYLVTAIIFSTLYPKIDLVTFLNRHDQIAKPMQVVVVNWQSPVATITHTFLGKDVWFWLLVTFWTGVTLFALRLVTQLLSLYRLHKLSEPAQVQHYMIRVIKGNINPFSFWRSIYINPENHPPHELKAILEHEQIHVKEWHTLDILLGELSAIFYWFNPGVWLMKRAIRENIEFITDRKILAKGVDPKAYQYSLLNVNFGAQSNAIVNHFNISTIKKRIIMMNAKRSSNVNFTRYMLLIPTVMVLLMAFSVSKAELNKAGKKTARMIHTFKTVVTQIHLLPEDKATVTATATPSRPDAPLLSALSITTIHTDTLPTKGDKVLLKDTSRKFTLRLRGAGNNGIEPDIYIDGVKSENGIQAINPNEIYSINVLKEGTNNPNGSIYVVTKDKAGKDTAVTVKGYKLSQSVTGVMVDGKGNQEVIVTGYPSKVTKVRLNGKEVPADQVHNVTVKGDSIQHLMIVNKADMRASNGTVRLMNIKRADGSVAKDTVIVRRGASVGATDKHYSLTFNEGTVTNIEKLSDKLIILNGKQVTTKELKKVSAADIENMSILSGENATAKYGDKGKNGVVLITTKKKS